MKYAYPSLVQQIDRKIKSLAKQNQSAQGLLKYHDCFFIDLELLWMDIQPPQLGQRLELDLGMKINAWIISIPDPSKTAVSTFLKFGKLTYRSLPKSLRILCFLVPPRPPSPQPS